MEDNIKILLLKILGQSFAATFKSLFGKGQRSKCFNKMCFPFNECRRGHRKGLKASNMGVSAVCHVPTAPPTAAVWTTAGCPGLEHQALRFVLPYVFTLALRGGHQPQSPMSQKQLSPQWFSHFPKPLLFYLHIQHGIKKSGRSHSKSHGVSQTQVHHECLPPRWIALIALDLSRENNLWARAFGLSFYPQKWTYWCSQRSGCYFKEVISLWGSDKQGKGIFVPCVFLRFGTAFLIATVSPLRLNMKLLLWVKHLPFPLLENQKDKTDF